MKSAATGAIQAIAHQGDPAPGGGVYCFLLLPVMNNRDDIVFYGDLTPADQSPQPGGPVGVFLYSGSGTIAVARPGDPLPGGGHVVTVIPAAHSDYVNNSRVVTFDAQLDTDENDDGVPDSGLYEWSHGTLSLVARTGTVISGVGTITDINPLGSGILNDRGQVLFQATLTDSKIVLLVATPTDQGHTSIVAPATAASKNASRDLAPWSAGGVAFDAVIAANPALSSSEEVLDHLTLNLLRSKRGRAGSR